MADVYKGKDHMLNRYVAIKVLKKEFREDETFVKKFRSEAQAAAGLLNPNIVNVYDVGEDRGLYYMVMELVDGITSVSYTHLAVKLAGKRGFSGLKGFVNGVLRNISRNLDNVKYPDKSDTVKWLSVMYSMPEWIITEWLKNYDREMVEKMLQAFLAERPTTIRCNPVSYTHLVNRAGDNVRWGV